MDDLVLHESDHRLVIRNELERHFKDAVSADPLPDQEQAAGSAPTKAEYDALVASHNSVLEILRGAGLVPPTPEEGGGGDT